MSLVYSLIKIRIKLYPYLTQILFKNLKSPISQLGSAAHPVFSHLQLPNTSPSPVAK
jgi:hypothetical protein